MYDVFQRNEIEMLSEVFLRYVLFDGVYGVGWCARYVVSLDL